MTSRNSKIYGMSLHLSGPYAVCYNVVYTNIYPLKNRPGIPPNLPAPSTHRFLVRRTDAQHEDLGRDIARGTGLRGLNLGETTRREVDTAVPSKWQKNM